MTNYGGTINSGGIFGTLTYGSNSMLVLNGLQPNGTQSLVVDLGNASSGALTDFEAGTGTYHSFGYVRQPAITINETVTSFSTAFSSTPFAGASLTDIRTIGGPVPEPATWAMFIGGFGLVGAAMRRKTANVSFAC